MWAWEHLHVNRVLQKFKKKQTNKQVGWNHPQSVTKKKLRPGGDDDSNHFLLRANNRFFDRENFYTVAVSNQVARYLNCGAACMEHAHSLREIGSARFRFFAVAWAGCTASRSAASFQQLHRDWQKLILVHHEEIAWPQQLQRCSSKLKRADPSSFLMRPVRNGPTTTTGNGMFP